MNNPFDKYMKGRRLKAVKQRAGCTVAIISGDQIRLTDGRWWPYLLLDNEVV